jgi:hypothetical protein
MRAWCCCNARSSMDRCSAVFAHQVTRGVEAVEPIARRSKPPHWHAKKRHGSPRGQA